MPSYFKVFFTCTTSFLHLFYRLPGLALDIYLYKEKVEINLLSDRKMIDFFLDSLRGGLSLVSDRLINTENTGKSLVHIDL